MGKASPLFRSLRFTLRLWGVTCGALFILAAARADETSLVARLKEKLAPRPAVWGEPDVGGAARVDPDPRAAQVLQGLKQIMAGPAAAAPAAAKAAAVNARLAQPNAVARLRAKAGADLKVILRPGSQTVMQVSGGVLEPASNGKSRALAAGDSERTARNFLNNNSVLLQLDDPSIELRLEAELRDQDGTVHLRFSQLYQGLSLWGAGLSVHLAANGDVLSLDGAYVPTPVGLDLQPKLTGEEAVARVKQGDASVTELALVIYAPLNEAPRLAWKFHYATDLLHSWLVLVSADDGTVLKRVTQIFDASTPSSGKDLAGVNRTINAWSANGALYLADTTKPSFNGAFDPIADPHGVISVFDARNVTQDNLKSVFIVQSNTGADWLPDAISALYNFAQTFDYYLERHNRNSIDGSGGNVQAVVRVAEMDNAFWNGNLKMMFFGTVRPYPVALDVVGHELTHGVTQNSAGLIYELQPGALNESFSDIFGEMVEARVQGQADWLLGEKLGKVFRDFKNPGSLTIGGLNKPYPSKMSEFIDLPNSNDGDHGGVHLNSSIVNHAFYLLAEGLDGAVGLVDAAKIFYRCLTQHLQPQSQFIDARLGCIASAQEIFGADSTQARKTAEAFDAVEIFATPPTPAPPPIPAVQAPDSTLIIAHDPFFGGTALGRRETAFKDPDGGVALVNSVKLARPSVSGDGSIAVFVDGAADICQARTSDGNVSCVGLQGVVHSVALSPEAKFAAIVLLNQTTGLPDNQISVIDLEQSTLKTFKLLAPTVDGNPANNVLYADSMVFTPDGKQLIYDAVSEIRFGNGNPVQRWSIFRINLPTEATTVLVPPIDGIDTGNPNIAHTTGRYMTFDAQDAASGSDFILNLDLVTGEIGLVARAAEGAGYPCFTGDDTAVVYSVDDVFAFETSHSLAVQKLNADRIATNGPPSLWLSDANLGVIYRRGAFTNVNALPVVTLKTPANSASFAPGASITLAADASDPDGTVARVEFYDGGEEIGAAAVAPFQFVWSGALIGSHRLFARAVDNVGGIADSAPISISVTATNAASAKLAAARTADGTIRLTLTGPAAGYTIQQSADLATWADAYPVTIPASGTATIDDSSGPKSNRRLFYRARKN